MAERQSKGRLRTIPAKGTLYFRAAPDAEYTKYSFPLFATVTALADLDCRKALKETTLIPDEK